MTSTEARVAAQFAADTADHELTILHDEGVYRHIRMARPGTGLNHFDLITWPGHLAISGDLDSYVFACVDDMFTFFRGRAVNPHYWAEKVKDGRERVKGYSPEVFHQVVAERLNGIDRKRLSDEQLRAWDDIREQVGDCVFFDAEARQILQEGEQAGLWSDTWEWNLSDWDWHFLYCLNAIVAGIAAYDKAKAAEAVSA